ncbi:hypothetical protein AUJ68_03075 [Candidatus Woesearchaeota archaeon CG1_02_57_44]|nr:MAG: hypothetical protein AUJ68_03075 [Candidatus Woesearchaeota archaeon CG1_02_57_44]
MIPSLRQKKRYIVFEVSPEGFSAEQVHRCVQQSSNALFGSIGTAKMEPRLVAERYAQGKGIIAINHPYAQEGILLLSSIKDIAGQPASVHTLKTSGTIKAAER